MPATETAAASAIYQMPFMIRLVCATFAAVLLFAAGAQAQGLVPPDADWRAIDTQNFRVTFTPELETVARRAAERAERAHALISRELIRAPAGKIDMVITNHVDFANGMATPFPRNQIIIYAHPPANTTSLDFSSDWLDLLIIHELVHIFHLDHASGPLQALRSVFGRNPVLFPQLWTTGWMVEGLAVYFESLLTGAGRVLGTHHDMILRTAILQDRFFSIDRASGDPRTWPGGSTRYIYGSLFVDHLARRHGAEKIPELVERSGRLLIPLRLNTAARRTVGVSFDAAWREWEDSLRVRYTTLVDTLAEQGITTPEIIVRSGRQTSFPRYSPSGDALAYESATGIDNPTTRLLLADGSTQVVGRRFGGGPISWRPDGAGYLDSQLEIRDRNRIFTDLLMVDRDGSSRWITQGERIWSADVHPDSRTVIAVADANGTNRLVIRDLVTGGTRDLIEPDMDVHWAHPRWSPDGALVAVSRMLPDARYDVVILDAQGSLVREVTADRALDATPAWSPDGRFLVFSSDRTGITNLYAYELATGQLRQVTNVITGALEPDVSPDGQWIAFTYYQADGYHIARVPFAPDSWVPAPPIDEALEQGSLPAADPARAVAVEQAPVRAYSPFPTVAPATWIVNFADREVLGVGIGAVTWGNDVVGRHDWTAGALVYAEGRRVEADAEYWYRGFGNPELGFDLSQAWYLQLRSGTELRGGSILPQALVRRDRAAGTSLRWVRPRFRSTMWAGVRGALRERELSWETPETAPAELSFREIPREVGFSVNGGISSVRAFALSTGPQQGASLATTLSTNRYLSSFPDETDPRGYGRLVGRSRFFHALFPRADSRDVLALRLDGGMEFGSLSPGFDLGGAAGGSPGIFSGLLESPGFAFPVRGYGSRTQWGNRVALGSAEYRVPLATVERGVGLIPVYLGRLSANAFADAGTAWCTADCASHLRVEPTSPDLLYSIGLEGFAELNFGFRFPLPLRAGVALPLRDGDGPVVYVRAGRSF